MWHNKKLIVGVVIVALVVAGAGIGYATWNSGGSSNNKDLIILASVQRRTLQDTVTLNGTLAREELRDVTSIEQGRVSAVYAKAGTIGQAGERLFALDGRDAIAEEGTVRFFRPLGIGDSGDDVVQLKQILAAAGDDPGPINSLYTEQTQFALAQWQAQHHYPDATPAAPESVTVSLAQGSGYTLGDDTSAGLVIGPDDAQTTAATSGVVHRGVLTAYRSDVCAAPVLTIQSVNAVVSEGMPATFVISASSPTATPITVNLAESGSADSNDIVMPPVSATLAANTTSVEVTVATRVDNVVKPTKTLSLAVVGGAGYCVGNPASALTSIVNNNVPTMHLNGDTTVSRGGSATLTVTADQAPLHDTDISLEFAGDATPGTDYNPVNPVLIMPAGQTTASVTVSTLTNNMIEPEHHIVVSITPSPTSYNVGSPGVAVIAIAGQTGDAALPVVTLRSATTFLSKGGSGVSAGVGAGTGYPVTISLNEALSRPLTIVLAYGGTAVQGTDFTLPGGSIVVPAGETSLSVQIPIVANNVVESDRVLVVALAPSSAYRIGSPNTAAVTIESEVMPKLTIAASTTTLAEGGSATFTITADQPPVNDTSVSYQVVGTAMAGTDYEPLIGTALLKAGQTTVTVTLSSIQKNVAFEPTDMIVGQWPIRIDQVFVSEGDPAPPGTPILELTDPNFTVTLQADASDRTTLKVGQSCTVELVGGTTEVPGTISELDSSQTALNSNTPGASAAASAGATPQEVYQGKIQLAGDLGAADGAAVTIDVVDQQDTNVLTVPIAAVKQNGSGQNVVRVIDVDHGGKITDVPVQTGLTEGSYIEITKGLTLNQTVIVDVDETQ